MRRSLDGWRREAIRRMDRSRRATLTVLSRLRERDLVRPRTDGQWSIKDVLAHIAGWENEGARRLELIARGHGHRIHFYHDPREIDSFNARVVAAARRTPLPALLRRLGRSRDRLTRALNRLPPDLLRDPSHEIPVVGWLPEFAWTHEQGHLRRIKTVLSVQPHRPPRAGREAAGPVQRFAAASKRSRRRASRATPVPKRSPHRAGDRKA